MAFSSLKLVGPFPPTARTIESTQINLQTERARALQVRCEGIQEQQQPPLKALKNTSRRDVMLCMSAVSLAATTIFSADHAEARIKNPDIRRKIMEKLEMLREKAGLSKPKTKDDTDKEKSPTPQPKAKETTPPPPPEDHDSPTGSLVEATIPK